MAIAIGTIAGILLFWAIRYLSFYYLPSLEGNKAHIPLKQSNHLLLRNIKSFSMLTVAVLFIAASTLFTAFTVEYFGFGIKAISALCYSFALIVMAGVDFRTHILPDILTKPLILLGLLQGYYGIFTHFTEALSGAALGYGLFWGINALYRTWRKKEGMGYGDFKLLAAIGAWCGVGQLPLVILFSSLLGIIMTCLIAWFRRHPLSEATPFGPSLAVSGLISLYFGNEIVTYYFSLFQ